MSTEYSNNEFLKGDFVMKRSGLDALIDLMQASGYAVTVVPVRTDHEYVRVVITKARSGFYE